MKQAGRLRGKKFTPQRSAQDSRRATRRKRVLALKGLERENGVGTSPDTGKPGLSVEIEGNPGPHTVLGGGEIGTVRISLASGAASISCYECEAPALKMAL